MKKLFLLLLVTALLGGCVVYPGYYGDYDSGYYDNGYYGYPYGYAGPNINLFYSGHYGWSGHHGRSGHHHRGHGGWYR